MFLSNRIILEDYVPVGVKFCVDIAN